MSAIAIPRIAIQAIRPLLDALPARGVDARSLTPARYRRTVRSA
jgi:hypothetical protein